MHDGEAQPARRPPRWWVALVVFGATCLSIVVAATIWSLGDDEPDPAEVPVNEEPAE